MTYLLACAGAYLAALLTVWLSGRLTGRAHLGLALGLFAISLGAITAAGLAISGLSPLLAESGAPLVRVANLAGGYGDTILAFCLPLIGQLVLALPFILILRRIGAADDEAGSWDASTPEDDPAPVLGAAAPSASGQRVEPTVY